MKINMKRPMLSIALVITFAFTAVVFAQRPTAVQLRPIVLEQQPAQQTAVPEKLSSHERVVTVRMPDGHLRAFKFERPVFKGANLDQVNLLRGPDSSCIYAFFSETCEYDEPTGFILCTAIYWSESCQLGAICYNWFGDCGPGCSLGGQCIEGIGSWLLD